MYLGEAAQGFSPVRYWDPEGWVGQGYRIIRVLEASRALHIFGDRKRKLFTYIHFATEYSQIRLRTTPSRLATEVGRG